MASETARSLIKEKLLGRLKDIIKNGSYVDPKSKFQEMAQDSFAITPSYKVVEESGPDHNKRFKVGVYLDNDFVAYGEGSSKQEAQVNAAENALKKSLISVPTVSIPSSWNAPAVPRQDNLPSVPPKRK